MNFLTFVSIPACRRATRLVSAAALLVFAGTAVPMPAQAQPKAVARRRESEVQSPAQPPGSPPAAGQPETSVTPAPAVPPRAPAQYRPTLAQRNMLHLQASLEELARGRGLPSTVGAIGGLLLGGLTAGYGVAVAVSGDELGQTAGRAALSGVALSAGLVMLTRGIQSLFAGDSTDRLRLARWRRAFLRGLPDATTVARFEGELAAEADVARAQRIASGVSNIGIALGGATLIAFGASNALRGHAETAAYLFGGTMLGIGALESLSLLLWTQAPHERVWQRYQAIKVANASPLLRVTVIPSLAPESFALALHATF